MKKIVITIFLTLCITSAHGEDGRSSKPITDAKAVSVESLGLGKRLFLTLKTDKPSAAINEQIPITVKLYVNKLNVTDIHVPTLYKNDLYIARFGEPKQYKEEIDGLTYDVLEFKATIFGTEAGSHRIGPALDSCNIVTKKVSSTDNIPYSTQPVELKSQDIEITISGYTIPGSGKVINGTTKDFSKYLEQGVTYTKQGDYDNAILNYTKAIEIIPQDAGAYEDRGFCYSKKGDLNRTIADYSQAIRIAPDEAGAYINRGAAYYAKRRFDLAIADFDKAIQVKPNQADLYFRRARVYHSNKEYAKATADINKAKSLGLKINTDFFARPNQTPSSGITSYSALNHLPVIVIFVVLGSIGFLSQKKKVDVLNKLLGYLQGHVSKFTFTPSFNGEYEGMNFRIMLTPASRSSPAYLTISISKSSSFKLKIGKESSLSKLGEKLGVVREIKTNDETFDAEFLIFSNNPGQAFSYLNNADTKNTIREFFCAKFDAFLINGKQALIQKPNYILNEDLDPQNIKTLLQKLYSLTRGIL